MLLILLKHGNLLCLELHTQQTMSQLATLLHNKLHENVGRITWPL